MNDAINIVLYIFNKLINFLFNEAYILDGVSIGWIVVTVSIFGILFNSILNTPVGLFSSVERQEKEKDREQLREIRKVRYYGSARRKFNIKDLK